MFRRTIAEPAHKPFWREVFKVEVLRRMWVLYTRACAAGHQDTVHTSGTAHNTFKATCVRVRSNLRKRGAAAGGSERLWGN